MTIPFLSMKQILKNSPQERIKTFAMPPFPVVTAHGITRFGQTGPVCANLLEIVQWVSLCRTHDCIFESCDSTTNSSFSKKICLTFDDALVSILEIAEWMKSPGTIFIVTDFVGKTNNWESQPGWVKPEKCVSWSQIRELVDCGWSVGAHSCTHPDFNRCSKEKIQFEIETSKKLIEERLGLECRYFAYPYGHAPATAREMTKELGMIAFGTQPGWVNSHSDTSYLPRLDIYDLIQPGLASTWAWHEPSRLQLQMMNYKRMAGATLRKVRRIAS